MTVSPAHLAELCKYQRYGQPGDPIPGSRYVRAYCAVCGDPIRVDPSCSLDRQECTDCKGALPRKIINQTRARRTETRGAIRGRS
jgi:hypothetical protein